MVDIPKRCRQFLWPENGGHQTRCENAVWLDGYCLQHYYEENVKGKGEEFEAQWKELNQIEETNGE